LPYGGFGAGSLAATHINMAGEIISAAEAAAFRKKQRNPYLIME
jgi:hypothetical protein